MINIQPTPNAPGVKTLQMRPATSGGQVSATSGVFARTTMATLLIVAAISALAITSLAQSERAQSSVSVQPESLRVVRASVPLNPAEVGRFAFGHVEIDWDPSAPGGVPGFDSWPPGSQR